MLEIKGKQICATGKVYLAVYSMPVKNTKQLKSTQILTLNVNIGSNIHTQTVTKKCQRYILGYGG